MKKATAPIGESLISQGLISTEQLRTVEADMRKTQEPFHKVLKRLHLVSEKDWIVFLSAHFGIPFVEVTHQIVKPEILKQVPEEFVRKFNIYPLMKVGKRLSVAVSDPFNLTIIDQLRLKTGFDIELMLATESEIRSAIEQNYGSKSEMRDVVQAMRDEPTLIIQKEAAGKIETLGEDTPIVKLVNLMLAQAMRDGASDIHVAPEKNNVVIRFRVDGVMRKIEEYPKSYHAGIVSRVKVMGNLDIAENRIPQDGRARFEHENQAVDLRISIMPTVHGENVVVRLLNARAALMSLEELGIGKARLETFKGLIAKPYGILLITGPTGSGKTTTLYAALNQINNEERNIVTIEDPVEYQLPYIRQIQTNPKVHLTFANGLRSILRQDPDVIMVGEIRDLETAEIAIQAALTGHMVYSTLHTNNAASAVTRLLDMGVEPFLVASTIVGIVAQRLVRVVCSQCRETYSLGDVEKGQIKEKLAGTSLSLDSIRLSRGKGCLTCRKTGFKGRSGIFEMLVPDEEIRRMVLKRLPDEEIQNAAKRTGMVTLQEDGFEKIKHGVTTLEEVLRVTQN